MITSPTKYIVLLIVAIHTKIQLPLNNSVGSLRPINRNNADMNASEDKSRTSYWCIVPVTIHTNTAM